MDQVAGHSKSTGTVKKTSCSKVSSTMLGIKLVFLSVTICCELIWSDIFYSCAIYVLADIMVVQGISEKCSSRCRQCVSFIAASNSGWRRQSEKYLVNRKHAWYIYGTQVCTLISFSQQLITKFQQKVKRQIVLLRKQWSAYPPPPPANHRKRVFDIFFIWQTDTWCLVT